MKIAIIGFSEFPVLPNAQHYLQEYAYQLIKGLVNLEYEVTYFGLYGSKLPCDVYPLNLNSIDWAYDGDTPLTLKSIWISATRLL